MGERSHLKIPVLANGDEWLLRHGSGRHEFCVTFGTDAPTHECFVLFQTLVEVAIHDVPECQRIRFGHLSGITPDGFKQCTGLRVFTLQ